MTELSGPKRLTGTVKRACDRSSTGAVRRTARHETRATRMNQRACNRSRAGGEVRTTIINRKACDLSRAGLAQAIASYKVRATNTIGGRAIGRLVETQSEVTWELSTPWGNRSWHSREILKTQPRLGNAGRSSIDNNEN
jgi:hypothetical protein